MVKNISATELKNKVSEVLNEVYFKKDVTVVERYGKPVARIVPIEEKATKTSDLRKVLEDSFGSLPDFPKKRRVNG